MVTDEQSQEAHSQRLPAPIWHTVLLCCFVCAPVLWTAIRHQQSQSSLRDVYVLAYLMFLFHSFFALVVWGGLALNETDVREMIVGRYKTIGGLAQALLIGVILFLVAIATGALLHILLDRYGVPKPYSFAPRTVSEVVVLLLATCLTAFEEELMFRGYFLKQIHALNGNIVVAVFLQAAIFVFAHGIRQTPTEVCFELLLGLLFAVVALNRRSLLPCMVAHFCVNAFSYVLMAKF